MIRGSVYFYALVFLTDSDSCLIVLFKSMGCIWMFPSFWKRQPSLEKEDLKFVLIHLQYFGKVVLKYKKIVGFFKKIAFLMPHLLQGASSWSGVKSILVDDFAGIGTEQILVFLKTDSISEATNTFQITDFGKCNHVVRFYWFSIKRIENCFS